METNLSEQLVIGVTAGLFAAGILAISSFLVRVVWRTQVEPWWENKLYGDARLDGEWIAELKAESTNNDCETVTVEQVGHNISGKIVCTNGPDEGRRYQFVGTFKNQILTGYYWNIRKTSIDSGSFSLRLENDGNRLKGWSSYYHDTGHQIVSREYEWNRRDCA